MSILTTIFGDPSARYLKKLQPIVDRVNALESEFEKLSDDELKNKTVQFRSRLQNGEALDGILPEAFAAVREAAKRTLEQRHFDVQILGGIVFHQGKIAEMKTGEGKTLAATLPLYLNALESKGAHLVTVNDYLARRDCEWMGKIYHALGMSVSAIQNLGVSYLYEPGWKKSQISNLPPTARLAKGGKSQNEESPTSPEASRGEDDTNPAEIQYENLRPCTRQEGYAADITYGTNNEFGFDYLRDNMARDLSQLVQRELNFAIVDEVDSILIDEARTPLIISAPAEESASLYIQFAQLVPHLKAEEEFEVDEKMRAVSLTPEGIKKLESMLGLKNIYEAGNVTLVHHLEEALKAQILFHKDKDYVVKDGEIIIVDEFTGRLMPGRRYSEGLHQAIEAKEGVEIKRESDTLATISFQNLFRLYKKLAGMTGTAWTEQEEFYKIYGLETTVVATNKPMIRRDMQDQVYKTEDAKFAAAVAEIKARSERGQPILVGTISIEKSEKLSRLLRREGVKHEVLNAKHHEREAKIIAQAGRPGQVTVATNMAGRGVDIVLGGIPAERDKPPESGVSEKVIEAGGLAVVGTERHEARRIDNQLRGRSGRQGDPGESIFYVSMEDELMRIFGGERLKNMMERLGLPDEQVIQNPIVSRSIESAQKKVEGHNFDIRKHLVEYDDVMNKHREVIYKKRRKILETDVSQSAWLHQEILTLVDEAGKAEIERKYKDWGEEFLQIEKQIYLSVIDSFWIEHLNTMDELRESVGLRGYGQVEPLTVYKQEGYNLFRRLIGAIENEVVNILLHIEKQPVGVPAGPRRMVLQGADESLAGGGIQTVPQASAVMVGGEDRALPAVKTATVPVPSPEPSVSVGRRSEGLRRTESSGRSLPGGSSESVSPPVGASGGVAVTIRKAGEIYSQSAGASSAAAGVPKVGRNEPCPCGSGKKYKKCHGK